jgi:hypothetical protein
MRRDAIGRRLPPLVAALAVVAVYAFTFSETYAWSDDYARLNAPSSSFVEDTSGGRPIAAPLMAFAFRAARSISGLRYLRAVSVLGVALLAASLAATLQHDGRTGNYAAFVAVTSALLPTFQMYTGWATAYLFPWVCLLSLWSGRLWLDAHRASVRAVGFAGFVIANLIYQPGAFFAWVIPAVRLSQRLDRPDEGPRLVGRLLVATIAGAAVALVAAWCVTLVVDVAWKQRAGFIHSVGDVESKIAWIVSRVLVIGARPFLIGSPSPAAALATAGPAFLLLAYDWTTRATGTLAQRIATIGLLVVVPVFAILPNAVVRENQIEFRILAGSCVAMWCSLCASASVVSQRAARALRIDRRHASRIAGAAQLLFIAIVAVVCRRHVFETMIVPNQIKDAFIATELRRFDPARHARIVVVNDPDWWGRTRRIGTFSLVSDLALSWVPAPDVELKAREAGIDTAAAPVTVATRADPKHEELLVDLSPLRAAIGSRGRDAAR